jgi:hypothetical protein
MSRVNRHKLLNLASGFARHTSRTDRAPAPTSNEAQLVRFRNKTGFSIPLRKQLDLANFLIELSARIYGITGLYAAFFLRATWGVSTAAYC